MRNDETKTNERSGAVSKPYIYVRVFSEANQSEVAEYEVFRNWKAAWAYFDELCSDRMFAVVSSLGGLETKKTTGTWYIDLPGSVTSLVENQAEEIKKNPAQGCGGNVSRCVGEFCKSWNDGNATCSVRAQFRSGE